MPRWATNIFPSFTRYSMPPALLQAALLQAFKTIAGADDAVTPRSVMALHLALSRTAENMRVAGQSIERLVAHVKSTATAAGVRESHDRIVTDAVLWAIAYYCGEDNVDLITWPAKYCRQRNEERAVPRLVDIDARASVVDARPDRSARVSEPQDGLRD
jgi:hypothetical protein